MFSLKVIFCIYFSLIQQPNSVQVIDVNGLVDLLEKDDKDIQVYNFWATWCGPCVKELPYFEELNSSQSNDISINLISVDFEEDFDKVQKFADSRNLRANLYLINNLDYNLWIDLVDSTWTGAIPATLIIDRKTNKRTFIEGEIDKETIFNLVNK